MPRIDKDTSIDTILKFDNPSSGIGSIAQLKTTLLAEPYSIEFKEKGDYVLLAYSQIDSDPQYLIVRQCRGTIIDQRTNRIMCRSFDRFGNFGESWASQLNSKTTVFQEKCDGSLIRCWHDQIGGWYISTRGTIDARDAMVGNTKRTFSDLFWEAEKNSPIPWNELDKESTYCYELCHPESRVIVPHEIPKLYYLGSRKNISGKEWIDTSSKLPERPKVYDFRTLEEAVELAKKLPWREEGYVAVDANFNRLKIKSPAYLAINALRMNGQITPRRIIESILTGSADEFVLYYPENKEQFDKVGMDISIYMNRVSDDFADMSRMNLATRKDYAEEAKKRLNPHVLFRFYGKEPTKETDAEMKRYMWDMGSSKLSELIYGER